MRPITIPGPLGDLARKIGDVRELARRCGVHPGTVRRWAETPPGSLMRAHVNKIAKRERVAEVWP